MAVWYSIFALENVGRIYQHYDSILTKLRVLEKTDPAFAGVAVKVSRSLVNFMDGLEAAARTTAGQTSEAIRDHIADTQKRDPTGRQGLEKAIVSSVLRRTGVPSGMVGIASIATLDKLTTRDGPKYRPYWRAQEYGFKGPYGRQKKGIRGYFTGPGYGLTKPSAALAGQQPTFVPMRGGGLMIPSPYPGRFFLREGTAIGLLIYKDEIRKLEERATSELRTIIRY